MKQKTVSRESERQRGQTIILVAISLISLLAMAALAIDVVTLYVARSETQRAADAAALAGAKAIADSGFTTLPPGDPNLASAQLLAQNMARAAIRGMLSANPPINQVAGTPPTLVGLPTLFLPMIAQNSNPHITVTLQVTTLPTFFARIWGNRTATVTASATAEAYNSANVQNFTPIAPKGVKPWLVANADPTSGSATPPKFVDPASGTVELGVIGETFNLVSDCNSPVSTACAPLVDPPPTWTRVPAQVDYLPAVISLPGVPNPNVCPACAGATDYEQSIECADMSTSYAVLSCGGGGAQLQWDNRINPGGPPAGNNATALGGECLIHASTAGPAKGQDLLQNLGPWPTSPIQFQAQSGPQNGNLVTTSSSIVTIPIFDNTTFSLSPTTVTVVGFLQAFINRVNPGPAPPAGSINITVLNVTGCSTTPNANPVVVGASGTSPIPVRLITPP
jgi:hypothetical protein